MQPDRTGRVGAALTWKDLFARQRLSRDLQRGWAHPETPQPFASRREEADTALRELAETSPPCSAGDSHVQPPVPLPVPPAVRLSPTSWHPSGKPKVCGECLHKSG